MQVREKNRIVCERMAVKYKGCQYREYRTRGQREAARTTHRPQVFSPLHTNAFLARDHGRQRSRPLAVPLIKRRRALSHSSTLQRMHRSSNTPRCSASPGDPQPLKIVRWAFS